MPGAPVLDSHALLKLFRDEPGADTVALILEKAGQRDQPVHMTEVNYAEVQYMVRRKDGDAAWMAVAKELRVAPIEFHPADQRLADLAADFKARHKLSLAGAFTAALAKERKTELVTGNPEFKSLVGSILCPPGGIPVLMKEATGTMKHPGQKQPRLFRAVRDA